MLGELIGPYKVVRLLGEGGMGQVYEATELGENDQPLRRAAIKVLRPEYISDRQMAGRFLNEARAIDVVDHPGIVTIYDIGVLPSGAPYIAMEYLDGDSLRDRLKSQGVTIPQALRIAEKLAQTLAAVHDKKIIHRDLKPENVMLLHAPPTSSMAAGYSEQVKVLDFGIAKVLQNTQGDGQGDGHIRTRTGVMIGTPTYMAPEQCGGEGEVCDRTDVYALGIMLYEMLAGRPPFSGDQDAQIIGKQLFQQPTAIQSLAPSVDARLAALVHRMLDKLSSARPAMREVAAALGSQRQVALGDGTATPGTGLVADTVYLADSLRTTLGQAAGQQQKNALRPLHLLFAAGLVLAAGLGVLVFVQGHRPPPHPATAPAAGVRWHIQSAPPGAAVVTEPDGQVLGQTPLDYAPLPAPGPQAVVLRQPGFADRRLLLSRSTSEERTETLIPAPSPLPAAPVPAVEPLAAPATTTATTLAKANKPPEPAKTSPSKPTPAPKPTQPIKRPQGPLRNEQVPLFR